MELCIVLSAECQFHFLQLHKLPATDAKAIMRYTFRVHESWAMKVFHLELPTM